MSHRNDGVGADIVLVIFVAALGATVLIGIFEKPLSSLLARGSERKLRDGTLAAYVRTAAFDLTLAHRAISQGKLADGEGRVAKAQDKLYAPQLAGRAPTAVAREMHGLEQLYGREFKTIRRQRALSRLGREGAEVPEKGASQR
ncbi:MAG: hypothetical protein NTY77_16845 [Elusimicrobia bacterium]|nr:hypothetical protein [Elusimicrobiota bacterium]